MFDARLRPVIDPPLLALARFMARFPIRADQVTLVGFALGCIGALFLAYQFYALAVFFLLANRLCDGVDGALARVTGQASDRGAYLDIVCDFALYALYPLAMAVALGIDAGWIATACLLFSFVCSGGTFLAHAVLAAKQGHTTNAQGTKGFFYVGGLMEGAETIVFLTLICLFPYAYVVLAGVFAMLCIATALGRVQESLRQL